MQHKSCFQGTRQPLTTFICTTVGGANKESKEHHHSASVLTWKCLHVQQATASSGLHSLSSSQPKALPTFSLCHSHQISPSIPSRPRKTCHQPPTALRSQLLRIAATAHAEDSQLSSSSPLGLLPHTPWSFQANRPASGPAGMHQALCPAPCDILHHSQNLPSFLRCPIS